MGIQEAENACAVIERQTDDRHTDGQFELCLDLLTKTFIFSFGEKKVSLETSGF